MSDNEGWYAEIVIHFTEKDRYKQITNSATLDFTKKIKASNIGEVGKLMQILEETIK